MRRIVPLFLGLLALLAACNDPLAFQDAVDEVFPPRDDPGDPNQNPPPPQNQGDPRDPLRIQRLYTQDNDQDGNVKLSAATYDRCIIELTRHVTNINVQSFSVSPDQNKVAIVAQDPNTTQGIYVSPINEPDAVIVTPPSLTQISDLRWSADGQSLSFTALQGGVRKLFGVACDGSNLIELASDVLFGTFGAGDRVLYRTNRNLYSSLYDQTGTELVSTLGDPTILARVLLSRDGKTGVYSKGNLYRFWPDSSQPPRLIATGDDIRADKAKFDRTATHVLFTDLRLGIDTPRLGRLDVDPAPPPVDAMPAIQGDATDFGFDPTSQSFWVKFGLGRLYFNSIVPATPQLAIDAALIEKVKFDPTGELLGASVKKTLGGPWAFYVFKDTFMVELGTELSRGSAWDWLPGTWPNNTPPGAPFAAVCETTAGDRKVATGAWRSSGGAPGWTGLAEFDFVDNGFVGDLKSRRGLRADGDPLEGVTLEYQFDNFFFIANGNDQDGGGHFTPTPLGFKASGIKHLANNGKRPLAPFLTPNTPYGVSLSYAFAYAGFGDRLGVTYEKNIALLLDEQGSLQQYEWVTNGFGPLQLAVGEASLTPTPGFSTDDVGFTGSTPFRFQANSSWALPRDMLLDLWKGNAQPDEAVYNPDRDDTANGFNIRVSVGFR